VIPVPDALTDDTDDGAPEDGVLELGTRAALALVAVFTGTLGLVTTPVVAVTVALSMLGGAAVVYAVLEELRRGVQRVDLGRLPFPSDERAQTSPRSTAKEAAGIVSAVGLVGLVEQYGVGGVLYQFFLSIIGAIQSAGSFFLEPLGAFTGGLADVVAAVFPARIINAAADFTAFSITQGDWNFFGPFTFAVGVVAVLMGLYVFVVLARRINFSPIQTLYNRRR
jgi:hypothetical protein